MTLLVLFALYPLCLSAAALIWLAATRARSRADWLARALACACIVAFAFLAGPWVYTSYYLRYVLLALFAAALAYSYRRITPSEVQGRFVLLASLTLVFGALTVLASASHYYAGEFINLSFPLRSGSYHVLQGGSNAVTNPFHAMSGSSLALDLVKLNAFGNRASGVAPSSLSAYEIFGRALYSPCAGTVLEARGHLPDNAPGTPSVEQAAGNQVVLECGGTEILLGHLMQRSLAVKPGDFVKRGQILGRVGNSGHTLEPHLHIEAKRAGSAVAMRFDGALLSVNSVVTRE